MGIQEEMVHLDVINGTENTPVSSKEDLLQPLPLSDFFGESIKRSRIVDENDVQHLYHLGSATFTICSDAEGYFIGMSMGNELAHITPHPFHYYHQLQNIYCVQYGEEFAVSGREVKFAWRIAKAFNRI